jgi:hypothetical protein
MTPRRWRKYVERGALLRPVVIWMDEVGPYVDKPTFQYAVLYRADR